MASRYEVEVTVGSARDLKNVNWRNGDLKPYAVLWVDDGPKVSTRVDLDNGDNPVWDDKLLVPLPPSATRLEDAVLYIDVVHANAAEGVKPLVGSARLPLRDVLDDAGLGGKASRSLRLKRPSGRPHGRLDVRVAVREAARYYPTPYPAPYGNPAGGSRDPYYAAPPPYAPAAAGYGQPAYAAPPSGYPAAAADAYGYGGGAAPAYGAAPAVGAAAPQKGTGKMGMGTGLAVGAAAGVLGGLALAGGASYLEDKFEERVAERVEDQEEAYGGGGYDDDY
ncbi:protein SRC2 homolog [Phragmites australis]|uniref:protein SRC2 homolog n=1 Tax=Phragmites australis TaxID=29695 RepID=UPI002D78172E|nr:protein SRC2 homolog [Phragmites australis]